MRLSVLDQSPIRSGCTPADAVRETLALAEIADRLGYHRYWLAEHHSSGGLAGSTPEILIGPVAARTRTIRVGSGGVMLSHYSPLKVAENFRMLETLYPGRIDLGIGRAPGSDQLTNTALAHGPGALGIEHFPSQINDLIGYLHGALPAGHPFARVTAMPKGAGAPELWLLGSSDQSASFAAYFGCAFSFAHFINDDGGDQVVTAYRNYFRPGLLPTPEVNIAVFCLCAETEEKAERLMKSRDLSFLRMRRGMTAPVPTLAEAEAFDYSELDRRIIAMGRRRVIAGTPRQVKTALTALAQSHGVDECVIVTICAQFEDRVRSYELIADAFALTPSAG